MSGTPPCAPGSQVCQGNESAPHLLLRALVHQRTEDLQDRPRQGMRPQVYHRADQQGRRADPRVLGPCIRAVGHLAVQVASQASSCAAVAVCPAWDRSRRVPTKSILFIYPTLPPRSRAMMEERRGGPRGTTTGLKERLVSLEFGVRQHIVGLEGAASLASLSQRNDTIKALLKELHAGLRVRARRRMTPSCPPLMRARWTGAGAAGPWPGQRARQGRAAGGGQGTPGRVQQVLRTPAHASRSAASMPSSESRVAPHLLLPPLSPCPVCTRPCGGPTWRVAPRARGGRPPTARSSSPAPKPNCAGGRRGAPPHRHTPCVRTGRF